MNLSTAFAASATRQPDKIALYWGDREYPYTELLNLSAFTANRLREGFDVKPGDRVGIWLKNCPEFIPALFGTWQAGAVVVPINNFLKPPEVIHILNDAGIDILITDEDLGPHFTTLKGLRPTLQLFPTSAIESVPASPKTLNSQPSTLNSHLGSDLAVIIYTSGTTGKPKGAMLSHANLLHNVESCRLVLQTVQTDRFAVMLPMFHSYMLTVGLLLPLVVGGSVVLVKSLSPVRNALAEIYARQASVIPNIPPFYRSLVSAPLPGPLPFRLCVSGAAPLPTQILADFEAKFHIPLIEGYGLSEASPVVTKNPLDGRRKPGSIGLAIPHVEVTIQDDSGNILPTGEIGELCVRGGNVMMGYWQRPEETKRAMRNDWLLTGDVGYQDAQGYFFITDRKKDMLLVNGINVYPREVEEILYQYPGVKEAAVIGVPDLRKGEKPIAFVSLDSGDTSLAPALRAFVRERLADYKVPTRITILPALPRNATGKILKTALRELAASQQPVADSQ